MQNCSSANTSINSSKLPAITKLIDWGKYSGQSVLDYGGGKFDNLKEYLKVTYNITLFVYDKYNRQYEENMIALSCEPKLTICSNVLNVIDSDDEIHFIITLLCNPGSTVAFYIYEGDRSGIGSRTKDDCYQRNMKTKDYEKFFIDMGVHVEIKGKLITITS